MKQKLASTLPDECNESIDATLDMTETLFTSASLLCPDELANRKWRFVSHSAQLCATSILHILASGQKLFPTEFWHTNLGQNADGQFQKQKKVLIELEDRRARDNSSVEPIRFIYVAWGVIKLGEQFLFYKREASEHANHFGFIGGRVKLQDLPQDLLSQFNSSHEQLEFIQSSQLSEAAQLNATLDRALSREFKEEAGLEINTHYQASHWININPWQTGMGGAPHYAQTLYFITLYSIELTTVGYLMLQEQMAQRPGDFLLCTVDEVVAGHNRAGSSIINIPAVVNHFQQLNSSLAGELKGMQDSYQNECVYNDDPGMIFGLESMQKGIAGQEQELSLDKLGITPELYSVLLGLAGHAKGFQWSEIETGVRTHDLGWISMKQGHQLCTLLNQLIQVNTLPLETVPAQNPQDENEERFFRLSANPYDYISFAPELFDYNISHQNNNYTLTLRRQVIQTKLGTFAEAFTHKILPNAFGARLLTVFGHDENNSPIANIEPGFDGFPRHVRLSLIRTYKPFGLTRFLCTENGAFYTRYVTQKIES
ncbi:MAG: hypothetical protein ACR2HF_09660 [Methylococcaceae bacterium]